MESRPSRYKRHRFPPEIIEDAVWLYYRFNLGRHLVAAGHYRALRQGAFASWDRAAAPAGEPSTRGFSVAGCDL